MRRFLGLVTALLLGFTLFSTFSYIKILKEKDSLKDKLNEAKLQLEEVSKERQILQEDLAREKEIVERLNQEKIELDKALKEREEKLAKINEELSLAERSNEIFKKQNLFLRKRIESLKFIEKEKEGLESKLNSLEELKKAIRELRRKLKAERGKEDTSLEGNLGYLIKNEKSTFVPKYKIEIYKIEVIPAPLDR